MRSEIVVSDLRGAYPPASPAPELARARRLISYSTS
jgi:hypothetical protein